MRLPAALRVKPWRAVLALAVGGVLVYAFLQAHIDLGQSAALLRKTNLLDYVAAITVFYAASVVRAARWKLLLRNAGERAGLARAWRIQMVGWFVNGILPAKPGDLLRARMLDKTYRTSTSKALGTIAMERLLDAGVLVLLIDLIGLLVFRTKMPAFFVVVLAATGATLAASLFTIMTVRSMRPTFRLPVRLAPIVSRFRAGLLGSVANVPLLLGITAFLWLMEGVRLYLVVLALPIPVLSWAQLTFVALAGSLLTAFPGLPGGLSLVEGGMVAVLVYFGLTVSVGLTVALLDRLINYWSVLLLSLLAFAIAAIAHWYRTSDFSLEVSAQALAGPVSVDADDRRLALAARRREGDDIAGLAV